MAPLVITALTESDGPAWADLMRQGFSLPDLRIAHFRTAVGDAEIRLARSGGRIAGTAALLPMAQWFGGRPVPAAGIAAVAVAASDRHHGVGTALMRALLVEARGRGLTLAVLHAMTLPLYRRLGFARAGVCVDYCLTMAKTLAPLADPARRAPLRLSRPALADRSLLDAVRRRNARWNNGMVERPPLLWANLLEPAGSAPPELHLIHGDGDGAGGGGGDDCGDVDGYLLLHPPAAEGGTVHVVDACLTSRAAAEQALALLAGFRGRATLATWPGGPEDALIHLAPETEVDIDDWDVWLVRVLDVPGALTARGWPAGAKGRLDLDIDDPLLTANHGRWRLHAGPGRGTHAGPGRVSVEPAPPADPAVPRLSLPVAALAPLLTGHLGAPALRAMGALDGDDGAVALAAALFSGPAPWLADRF